MLGTAHGGVCYSSQSEAASAFCASSFGVTSFGYLSCQGIDTDLSSVSGGSAVFSWRYKVSGASGVSEYVSEHVLQDCETYGLDYWQPVIIASVGLFVFVWACNRLIDIFSRGRDD